MHTLATVESQSAERDAGHCQRAQAHVLTRTFGSVRVFRSAPTMDGAATGVTRESRHMQALVVYESMFGDSQAIAEAVAAGLSGEMAVNVVEVGAAPASVDRDVDLLVVGGPTHAFGMSRPATRDDALTKSEGAGVVSKGDGLREWLDAVHVELDVPAVAFDTRINKPRVPGSAAHAAQRRLRHIGCSTVAPAESFYVHGTRGPLIDGEVDRAQQWGRQLLAKLPHPQADTPAK